MIEHLIKNSLAGRGLNTIGLKNIMILVIFTHNCELATAFNLGESDYGLKDLEIQWFLISPTGKITNF